jgi:hypothetical protein
VEGFSVNTEPVNRRGTARPIIFDANGLVLPSPGGVSSPLSGFYSAKRLTQLFVTKWIDFTDCGSKCTRRDHCGFTKQNPNVPNKLLDIRCGAVVEALRSFVRCSFSSACKLSPEQRQNYIDAAFQLTQFVTEAEWYLGGMMNKEFMNWWGTDEFRLGFFSLATRTREHLDSFAGKLSKAGLLRFKRTLILVEGPSEKMFLEKLRLVAFTWFQDLRVETYAGRSNRRYANLRLYAQRLREDGYELFIQGDGDARTQSQFHDLV